MNQIPKLSLIIIVILAASSCGNKKAAVEIAEKAIPVTVSVVERGDLAIAKTYSGTLEGAKQAEIVASIHEAVVELPVSEGDRVSAGQVVIMLDKNGLASQYNQASALYLEAKDNYQKMTKLLEQGAISEQTFISARTGFEVAQANFRAASRQVELTSPISGILTELSVNVGEYAPVGIPIATVAETARIRLTIFVDSQSSSFIKKGQKASIMVESSANSDRDFMGSVTEVSRSADPQTRLFRVEISIDNEGGELAPGTFARVEIVINQLESVLVVPKEAVFSVEGVYKVYRIEGDRASEQTINVGESTLKSVQIISGLSEGDTVAVIGRNLIENGSPVKIVAGNNVSEDEGAAPESSPAE
jgi:membrane fusion protein (multidrug efflux system)